MVQIYDVHDKSWWDQYLGLRFGIIFTVNGYKEYGQI